uniref:Uncharacterized protein n=1 Tax=Alexandrium catenella TaxID=2925 RepID=A0A7S1WKZ0_ALECA
MPAVAGAGHAPLEEALFEEARSARRARLETLDELRELLATVCEGADAAQRTVGADVENPQTAVEAFARVRLLRRQHASLLQDLQRLRAGEGCDLGRLNGQRLQELEAERERTADLERRLAAERANSANLLAKWKKLAPPSQRSSDAEPHTSRGEPLLPPTARTARTAILSKVHRALNELRDARDELAASERFGYP